MGTFNYETASPEELWDYCMEEYRNPSKVVRLLLDHFFASLGHVLEQLPPSARILEAGCGCGESSRRILKMLKGQHFEASEFDHRYVEMMLRNNFPIPVRQESVYEMGRADGEFDCVMLLEVLEHLESPEKALEELFRVSSKHVIISVPNEPLWSVLNMARGKYLSSFGNTPGHINQWSARGLRKLIEKHGVIRRIYRPTPWLLVHAERRSDA